MLHHLVLLSKSQRRPTSSNIGMLCKVATKNKYRCVASNTCARRCSVIAKMMLVWLLLRLFNEACFEHDGKRLRCLKTALALALRLASPGETLSAAQASLFTDTHPAAWTVLSIAITVHLTIHENYYQTVTYSPQPTFTKASL
jgi:hypothetical protein